MDRSSEESRSSEAGAQHSALESARVAIVADEPRPFQRQAVDTASGKQELVKADAQLQARWDALGLHVDLAANRLLPLATLARNLAELAVVVRTGWVAGIDGSRHGRRRAGEVGVDVKQLAVRARNRDKMDPARPNEDGSAPG